MLEFFVNTAMNADRKVFPYRQDEPSEPVDDVTPLDFDSDEQTMGWCVRELTNLMALVHNANREGWYEYAIRLPMAVGEILQRLGFYDDVLSGLDVAIKAARSLGDLAGEAIAVGNLGNTQPGHSTRVVHISTTTSIPSKRPTTLPVIFRLNHARPHERHEDRSSLRLVQHDHEADGHSKSSSVTRVFVGLLVTLGTSALGLLAAATSASATEDGKYWGCSVEP